VVDNQHRDIAGYRDLTHREIAVINDIKGEGARLGLLVTELRGLGDAIDQRWLSIGATDLQRGLMALVRAVAQPEGF
jgi:hypothetical protein